MHTPADTSSYQTLLSSAAVRERCSSIGKLAIAGETEWLTIREDKIPDCVGLVHQTCAINYPDFRIPLHSRWRHFRVGDTDLWEHYTAEFCEDNLALARSAVDLVFVSVLVDAGAGDQWSYTDPVTGSVLSRSEGLAAASVDLFFNHLAMFDPLDGWSITAHRLRQLDKGLLARVFQHSQHNALTGLEGRLALLHGLGDILAQSCASAYNYERPGNLVDQCLEIAETVEAGRPRLELSSVLSLILNQFGAMWPSGLVHNSIKLGDCGFHSKLAGEGSFDGIVPFHKLSQWLAYSLVEPLELAGMEVVGLDSLTGLPEYRNGGLFLDTGVLAPRQPEITERILQVHDEPVVEWRALTVFLLDRIAEELRTKSGLSARELPLCAVLQGGTWAAGRSVAARLREGGGPPLKLAIDGTVF